MSFMKLPKCPYCGKPLSYRKTWNIRKYGDYECDRCHQEYDIKYSKGVYVMVLGLLALEVFLFITFRGVFGEINAFTLILMAAPVLILYFMLPLMMSLRRKKGSGKNIAPADDRRRPPRTKIYEPGGRPRQAPSGQPPLRQRPDGRPVPGEQRPAVRQRPPVPGLRPGQAGIRPTAERPLRPESANRIEQGSEDRRADRPTEGLRREQRPSVPRGGDRRRPQPEGQRSQRPENRPGQRRAGAEQGREPLQKALSTVQNFSKTAGAAIVTGASIAAGAIGAGALWVGGQLKNGALWVSAAAQKLWTSLTAKIGDVTAPRGKTPKETRDISGRDRGDRRPPARRNGERPMGNRSASSSSRHRPGQRPASDRRPAPGQPPVRRREEPVGRRPENQRGDRDKIERREPDRRRDREDDPRYRRSPARNGSAGNRPSGPPRDRDR